MCRPVVLPGGTPIVRHAHSKESKLGYAENLGSYRRGRYKVSPGKYATVRDANGEAIRFRTKASAKRGSRC